MGPFEPPEVVLTGFKERIEALTLQGIFILESVVHYADPMVKETAFTSEHRPEIYPCTASQVRKVHTIPSSESPYMMLLRIDGKSYAITQLETKKGLTRRAIDQLGVVKDINSLVVLSRA